MSMFRGSFCKPVTATSLVEAALSVGRGRNNAVHLSAEIRCGEKETNDGKSTDDTDTEINVAISTWQNQYNLPILEREDYPMVA